MDIQPVSTQDGSVVGLCKDGILVATGTIMCSQPGKIVHCIPLGVGNVQVRVEKVHRSEAQYAPEERWGDMVGALIVCNVADLRHPDFVFDSDDVGVANDKSQSADIQGIILKKNWKGISVKVMDNDMRIFATAEIVHVEFVLDGILLGETHLGILSVDFIEGATRGDLKYQHAMKAWDMRQLIANDGKSMADHHEGQAPPVRDASSKKRIYVSKTRYKKPQSVSLSKKEKCLTEEDVAQISAKDCCSQACCQHFPRSKVEVARKKFWEKSFALHKEDEINAIVNALDVTTGEKVVVIQGRAICLEAWQIIHGRGRSQFYELKRAVRNGVRNPTHGNLGKRRMSERVCRVHLG